MHPHQPAPAHRPTLRAALFSGLLSAGFLWPLPAATQQTAPSVSVVAAQVRAVGQGFELDGVVQPVKQSTVAAQTQGRVARLWVQAGDAVKAGQVVATVDDRESQAGLDRTQAGIQQAEAHLRNTEAQWKRTRDLKAQGFVAQAALDGAEAAYSAAQAAAREARAAHAQSTLTQAHTRITAPYAGFVLATHAESGDLATPGKPLLTLYAPAPLRVVVHVPASRSAVATQAQQITIYGPGGNPVHPSTTTRVPAADPVSQTVEWRLDLPATSTGWVPGQQVKVRWQSGTEQRLVVPSNALLRRGELTAVYVSLEGAQGSRFTLRAIRTGTDHGAAGVEVLAGLQAGEWVALDPVRAGLAQARPGNR